MRYIFLSIVLGMSVAGAACGIHQFKVPLNQRGFYNPAALCPYCEGSMYFATGAFAAPRINDIGMFAALGNDGDNATHGAWDLTCSYLSGENNSTRSFSTRYAYKMYIGKWALATGMRAAYNTYSMILATPESYAAKSSRNCFSFDAGLYVTNQEGFYAGVSALNLHEPSLAMKFNLPAGDEYYYVQTKRSYTASVGGLVTLSRKFDVMLDASGNYSDEGSAMRPSFMMRYKHHIGLGGGVTLAEGESPVMELQGGFTSTPFKWLAGVAFTEQGPVIETGLVIRFGVETGRGNWRLTRVQNRCVAQPIRVPKKTEFFKED